MKLPHDSDEQNAIVEVLDGLDAKIDLHERKWKESQELFQSMN